MSDQPAGRAGIAELGWVSAEACSANGFDGRVPRGATIPRDVVVCFVVSPRFTPHQVVVGGPDAPTHLRLPG